MESTEDLQTEEITVLKSIYGQDFIECPPPKAWKGAARLHEFIIPIQHATQPDRISVNCHIKLPKTYPHLACPIFTLQKPAKGVSSENTAKLQQYINAEAQKQRGTEMVFNIISAGSEWLESHVVPPAEVSGSLAVQMNKRALNEEKNRRLFEEAEAARQEEIRQRQEMELQAQIEQDLERQRMARAQQQRRRERANSETTEVPFFNETPVVSFGELVIVDGVSFMSVKLFHPRKGPLQTIYLADPISDSLDSIVPLEVHIYTFQSPYYSTSQGRKKLNAVEAEIKEMVAVRHDNLLPIYAVKLSLPNSRDPPSLIILMEQSPRVSLQDLLGDSDVLREERATQYLTQVLQALNALHQKGLVHRGIDARCIGLAVSRTNPSQKHIKLAKAVFHTHLLDLHRSNPFDSHLPPVTDEIPVSEGWLSRDARNESTLLYTKRRDIHNVGIVLLQMLMGLDVTERFSDAQEAIHASSISPALARQATNMLLQAKKNNVTCMSLLSDLAEDRASQQTNSANQHLLHTPTVSRAIPMSTGLRTPVPSMYYGSPEVEYVMHRAAAGPRASSRWKDDWEELERLGKGAFGSVVKARNKIDGRIYAVKKVRLSPGRHDEKIMREVNALSRLNHRFIVRYYTTWIEVNDAPMSTTASDDSSAESSYCGEETSVPDSSGDSNSERFLPNNSNFRWENFDDDFSVSQASFPSIHFEADGSGSGRNGTSDDDDDDDDDDDEESDEEEFDPLFNHTAAPPSHRHLAQDHVGPTRTLYIQMEFVERQTLKERIEDGISEDEAWRLFHQIVDALSHMSNLGILHRDIKLTNIFIDAKGDCKVGDLGLATFSLADVEPVVTQHKPITYEPDMTLEVGTRLYIAPEVQARDGRKAIPRNQSKADMYSLGIVFFEMNYQFSTGSERIAVLEDLRKPSIIFPVSWDPHRKSQKEIIIWLLQHNPDRRPTALQLLQSPLLPARVEDEYFKKALDMMAKPDTPYHQNVLQMLFNQPTKPSRGFLYDKDLDRPDYLSLADAVQERLAALFKLHGAVDIEPPLLLPVMEHDLADSKQANLVDPMGNLVGLPSNLLVPMARLAGKGNAKRIKRYHISNIYRVNPVAGHPIINKAAVFDIITQDLASGPVAAGAEIIALSNDIVNAFPGLQNTYHIRVSHSHIVEIAMSRVSQEQRASVTEILLQSKSSPSQKRALLLKKGLARPLVDDLEVLNETEEDVDRILAKLEKNSSYILPMIRRPFEVLKKTLEHAAFAGAGKGVVRVHPLMLGAHHALFKDGILVDVTHRNKPSNVLAAGGRFDHIIARHSPAMGARGDNLCAMGLQIAIEKILAPLAVFQSNYVPNLIKEERSFGYWSPRRCDVYVVSYHEGYLQDRLEVTAYLWRQGISADLMYESAIVSDTEHERLESVCEREGILFTVCPRPRTGKQTQSAFKVRSILKGTEYDLSWSELASWLQYHIAEQKRVDLTTYGTSAPLEVLPSASIAKDHHPHAASASAAPDVHLVLPADVKKQRKSVKHMLNDRAFETSKRVRSALQTGNMPTIAIDVPPAVFDALARSAEWLNDDSDAWKNVVAMFPPGHAGYAAQVRENVRARREEEGCLYVLLFAVREERVALLTL